MRQFAIMAALFLGVCAGPCMAQTIPSKELINNAKAYDGKTLVYKGEAVGEIMVRGDYAWISLNDGSNALGIWVRKDAVAGILVGNYNAKGDILEVTGIFHRACLEHGGDLDIHAESITLVEKGRHTPHQIQTTTIRLSAVFFVALLLVIFWPSRSVSARPAK